MNEASKTEFISLLFNIACSAYHVVFGFISQSWWLLTVGTYYAVLSSVRFFVILTKNEKLSTAKFVGAMLMLMSIPLSGTVILSFLNDRGIVFHEIVMITFAVYAFTKITHATLNLIKSRKSTSLKLITLRHISFATAFVSIFSLQRSMLVSFGNMPETSIRIMNLATGSAVCVIVFVLGLNLVRNKRLKELY